MKYLLNKRDFEIISTNDKDEKLLFYTPNSQLFSIKDESIIKYLEFCKAEKKRHINSFMLKESYNLLNNIFKNSYQPSQDNEDYKEIIDTVILPISGKCNLKCSYCFASDNNNKFNFTSVNETEVKKIIDFLFITQNLKTLHISFFGGEPLLKIDIINYVIDYIKENFSDRNIKYSITTNGTILNKRVLDTIKKNNIPLLISLDGPKELNIHRKFSNGKNSFDKILKNISILRKNNVDVNLRATMTNDNLRILDTHIFFENLGIPFKIIYAHDSLNSDDIYSNFNDMISVIENEYRKLISYYLEFVRNNKKINCLSITDKLTKLLYRSKNYYACTGGRSLFSITSEGKLYTCEHLSGIEKFSVGNINTGINKDLVKSIQSTNVENIEDCSNCWLRYFCSGGCFANNISGTGDVRKPELNKCNLIKSEYRFIMILYNEINKINPSFFDIVQ